MKVTIILLLCLAARNISGSVFVRESHQQDSDEDNASPYQYIDQLQHERQKHLKQQIHEQMKHQIHQKKNRYQPSFPWRYYVDSNSVSEESNEKTQSPRNINRIWRTAKGVEKNTKYGDVIVWRNMQDSISPYSDGKEVLIERIYNDAYPSMNQLSDEEKTSLHAAAKIKNEDVNLNATQLCRKYKYVVEEHSVKTDDGYWLTVFRIPPQKVADDKKNPVVFLMHGLLGSADNWLLTPDSLAYLLADAGYDVWLGNVRGNKYSRRHVAIHPARPEFWQYSNDEIALHDLPAMIDYALKTSEQEKLYYVGHSQGTTTFFALLSTFPEYNEKVVIMYALAPMVYMSHVRSPVLRMMAPDSVFFDRLHERLGYGEFKLNEEQIDMAGKPLCEREIGCRHICSNVYFLMAGFNVRNLNISQIRIIMSHLPAGGSTRQMKHYGQGVTNQEFRRYDYGIETNKVVYGSRTPPKYELKNVTVPVSVYFSEEDWLAQQEDVERLRSELPNVVEYYKVPESNFSDMDFQFSKKAPELIYKNIIESIKQN